jgi:hypothetical protein
MADRVKAGRTGAGQRRAGRVKLARATKSKPRTRTDPVLLEQIDAARRRKSIDAVFTLRLPRRKVVEPGSIEKLARTVLDRVAAAAGVTYSDINVFGNLGAFAISAEPAFLRALIRAPEIAAATASRRGKGMLISPRRKRPVRP